MVKKRVGKWGSPWICSLHSQPLYSGSPSSKVKWGERRKVGQKKKENRMKKQVAKWGSPSFFWKKGEIGQRRDEKWRSPQFCSLCGQSGGWAYLHPQ